MTVPAVAAQTDITVIARDDGHPGSHNENAQWFQRAGAAERNPTLHFAPGESIHVLFVNNGTNEHSIHFGSPIDQSTPLISPGQTASLDFVVPTNASAAGSYWCDAHRDIGMLGTVDFGGTAMGKENVSVSQRSDLIPGFTVPIVVFALAFALMMRRRT